MEKSYKGFVVYEKDKAGQPKKNIYGKNMNNNNRQQYNNNQNQNENSILELNDAMAMSSYPQYMQDFIKSFLIDNYSGSDIAQIFLITDEEERIFVIEYSLEIEFNGRNYKVFILVYLPILFPNYPPEFYIERNANISLNNFYKDGKISEIDFKINLDFFGKFDPNKNNISELIDNLLINFTQEFPVFKSKTNDTKKDNKLKCYLNKSTANVIILPEKKKNYNNIDINQNDYNFNENNNYNNIIDKKLNDEKNKPFDDKSFLEFIRNQAKDVIRYNYLEFKEKYRLNNNLEELKNLGTSINKRTNNDALYLKNQQLKKQLESLKNIKERLKQIENNKINELKNLENLAQKSFFERYENIIEIENHQLMDYIVKIKVLEDYLAYLKKGYEKNIISFQNMLKLNRSISREIFNLNYAKDKIQK